MSDHAQLMKRALDRLQQAQARIDALERAAREPVAIVGISCRFPGGADTPERLFALLCEGVDTVTEVPPTRWSLADWYDPDPDRIGKTYCRHGSFLDDIDQFDPTFFGISRREAARMDPQQRLLLEVSWEAIERAGIDPASLHGTRTGVFVGMMGHDYTAIATRRAELIDGHTGNGNSPAAAAGRLSHVLGLQGPAMTIDTACSSSLVAVHQGVQALRTGDCDHVLACGVNLALSPVLTLVMARNRMLSATGRCRAFDASADGVVRGEGCGVVLLKRLSDALAAADPIIAVIRGSAVNHDGACSSLTVPNGQAQQRVIRAALQDGAVSPEQVGVVEAHGTGTPLGDPIELDALGEVYGEVLVSSLKTNMGHLEGAAGIAGLIKVALELQFGRVVPHLHLAQPTPHVAWDRYGLRVPTTLEAFPAHAPYAAVSSFGFSGTNAHVVLERAPGPPETAATHRAEAADAQRPRQGAHALCLSANSQPALRSLAAEVADAVERGPVEDVCLTALASRSSLPHRLGTVGRDAGQIAAALRAFAAATDDGTSSCSYGERRQAPRVAFLFPGQGSHARELAARSEPVFEQTLARCAQAVGYDFLAADLEQTEHAQPALVAIGLALAALLRSWGIQPALVFGHSVGEYAAAIEAGVFDLEAGMRLVAERGRLMQGLPQRGAMLAVGAADVPLGPGLTLAAINGPRSIVVSGRQSAIDELAQSLRHQRVPCQRLDTSHAFHCSWVEPVLPALEAAVRRAKPSRPDIDLLSCSHGELLELACTDAKTWSRHAREPVRFDLAVQALRAHEIDAVVELGPRPTLSASARQFEGAEAIRWLPALDPRDPERLLRVLVELRVLGCQVRWPARGRKIAIPTTPFERERCWLDGPSPWQPEHVSEPAAARGASTGHPLLGRALQSPALPSSTRVFAATFSPDALVNEHRVFGHPLMPAAAFFELAAAAVGAVSGGEHVELRNVVIEQPLIVDQVVELQTLISRDASGAQSGRIVSRSGHGDDGEFRTHVSFDVAETTASASIGPNIDVDAQRAACDRQLDPAATYASFAARGFDYGPSYRALKDLARGAEQLIAGCSSQRRQGHWLDPVLLDAAMQTAAVRALDQDDSSAAPVSVARLVLRRFDGSRAVALCRGDTITLCEHSGAPIAQLQGLRVSPISRASFGAGRASDMVHRVVWRRHEHTQHTRSAPARRFVVIGDGPFAAAIATALGASRRSLRAADGTPAHRVGEPYDAGELAADVDEVVYVGADGADGQALCLGALQTLRELHVHKPRLTLLGDRQRPLAAAALAGFGHVVANERPDLRCLRLEVDSSDLDVTALRTGFELDSNEDRVSVRGAQLFVPRLERVRVSSAAHLPVRAGQRYLVTGGLGGLGLRVASWLAKRGATELVLLGRSAPSPAALEAIQRLSRDGVRVQTTVGDVADSALINALGPLRGVVHCAGVLDDATLDRQDERRFANVFRPKVDGALVLHEHTRELDFFVLFSSMAAVFGLPGQANYAAANAELRALAELRRGLGQPALCIDWGPFADVGMAARLQSSRSLSNEGSQLGFGSSGWRPMAIDALDRGLSLLGALPDDASVCVFSADWERLAERLPQLTASPFLARLSGRTRASNFASRLASTSPERRMQLLRERVIERIASVLQSPPDRLISDRSLFDSGVDSLMAVEIRTLLAADLPLRIRSTLVFDYPTVDAIVAHLSQELGLATSPALPQPDVLLDQIQTLSESELVALIDQEMEQL